MPSVLDRLTSPWRKNPGIYGVSLACSLPTAGLIALLFPDAGYPALLGILAGLALVAVGAANTPIRALAATGYLHAAAALPVAVYLLYVAFFQPSKDGMGMDSLFHFLGGLVLMGSTVTAVVVSSIALGSSFHGRSDRAGEIVEEEQYRKAATL